MWLYTKLGLEDLLVVTLGFCIGLYLWRIYINLFYLFFKYVLLIFYFISMTTFLMMMMMTMGNPQNIGKNPSFSHINGFF